MRTLIICAGFALALLTGPAWGGEVFGSANHMTPSCRVADPPRFEEGYCLGLVTGLASGAVKRSADLKAPSPFCLPPGVTGSQMVRVVVQYIEQRPQRMHEPFTVLAYETLKAAWPCKP
jgi:hypothetical protein